MLYALLNTNSQQSSKKNMTRLSLTNYQQTDIRHDNKILCRFCRCFRFSYIYLEDTASIKTEKGSERRELGNRSIVLVVACKGSPANFPFALSLYFASSFALILSCLTYISTVHVYSNTARHTSTYKYTMYTYISISTITHFSDIAFISSRSTYMALFF